ncbi:dienelactone hydrolase family protein [Sabulilitoribacter arenilitoris]|uniref:Dienelactone hydrolase family protein n=1 Tax=Wocania arenilitoris TaxID=2044858 RepID=A0AAE3EPT6_9FLAO|nr:PHB depolymerase family esterase [Wocania arenilitoris]MCF7569435.1 dienelactone hydrolase family protein [Wocania arenilitoris]
MKNIFYLLFCALGMQTVMAQQTNEKFIIEEQYLKYLPEQYEDDLEKKWPLLIFLHGSGERGTDIEKVKVHGPPMLAEKGKQFPFIIISPQAKTGWDEDVLYQMITDFIAKNRVDTDRIYLTGLSLGGHGTWNLAQKHPEMFAAIAPICGWGNVEEAWKLRHMPVWCFHGGLDTVVPVSASEDMINALKPINPNVKFTIYPETYHDSWIQAYGDSKLYEWFLRQKKYTHKAIDLPLKTLKQYVGEYDFEMGNYKTKSMVTIENGNLIMKTGQRTTTLIPSSEDTFFIDKNQQTEFKFIKNEAGNVDKILLYYDELVTIPKSKE